MKIKKEDFLLKFVSPRPADLHERQPESVHAGPRRPDAGPREGSGLPGTEPHPAVGRPRSLQENGRPV